MESKEYIKIFEGEIKKIVRNPQYKKLIESAKKVRKRMFGLDLHPYEIPALVSYAERWDTYRKYLLEGNTTTRDDVAPFLTANLGVVAFQYASLPIPIIASTQPLSDEVGRVYYRKFIATTTRGGVNEGDVLLGNLGAGTEGLTDLPGYYGESQEVNATITVSTAGSPISLTQDDFGGALLHPVRPGHVRIYVYKPDGTLISEVIDNREGQLLGYRVHGTIDYETGNFTLEVDGSAVDVTGDYKFVIQYKQNLLSQDTGLPGIKYEMGTKLIHVEYFIVNTVHTYFTSFDVQRRFGISFEDQIVADLINQMNSTIMSVFMVRLVKSALKQTGASVYADLPVYSEASITHEISDWRMAKFWDAVIGATQRIARRTSRQVPTFIVVSDSGRKVVSTIGLQVPPNNPTTGHGAFYMGTLNYLGTTVHVFYATPEIMKAAADKVFSTGVTLEEAANLVVVGHRGDFWFDAPMVYAPYLPITIGKGNVGYNVFTQAHAITHGAGIDSLVPELTDAFRIEGVV